MAKRDRSAVRAQVVTTLYSLDCGRRRSSPRSRTPRPRSGRTRRAGSATASARTPRRRSPRRSASRRTKRRSASWRTLSSRCSSIRPAVVDVLLEVAGKPGIARVAAVRGLIQAASAGSVDGARCRAPRHAPGRGAARARGIARQAQGSARRPQGREGELDGAGPAQVARSRDAGGAVARARDDPREDCSAWVRDAARLRQIHHGVRARGRRRRDPAGGGRTRSRGAASQPGRHPEARIALARALLLEKTHGRSQRGRDDRVTGAAAEARGRAVAAPSRGDPRGARAGGSRRPRICVGLSRPRAP